MEGVYCACAFFAAQYAFILSEWCFRWTVVNLRFFVRGAAGSAPRSLEFFGGRSRRVIGP